MTDESTTASATLTQALRRGRWRDVWPAVSHLPESDRTRLRRVVRPVAAAISAAPTGARSAEGQWVGELTAGHHNSATAALLATATLAQAQSLHPIDMPVARELPPQIFPDGLGEIADAWSDRYHRGPKAWDRIRGIEAMFDWAQQGLIEPPTRPGAVLLLITGVPGAFFANDLLAYLEARPVLLDATLPALFTTPGIKGASAAQRDAGMTDGGLAGRVIPELIRRGHWERAQVITWCDTALRVPRSEYEYRWFRDLRASLLESPS